MRVLHHLCREIGMKREPTPGVGCWVQVPEHDAGVRHRRVPAPTPVAGRPRIRTRALRPDPQTTRRVKPRDTATSRPDGVDIDHGDPNWIAPEPPFRPRLDAPPPHQSDIEAGAAHVERHHVVEARQRPRHLPGHDPGRRPGEHGPDGALGGNARGCDPAVRLHDLHRTGEPVYLQLRLEIIHVPRDDRAEIRRRMRSPRDVRIRGTGGPHQHESETSRSGHCARMTSAVRRSCAGFRNEKR